MRKPISITIGAENLLWLKGQALASARGTVSGIIDSMITEARHGRGRSRAIRSVKGTVRIPPDDPDLAQARDDLRNLFEASLSRPLTRSEARRPVRVRRQGGRG